MSIVTIKCPVTGQAVSTGIEIDWDTFGKLPKVTSRITCSACGKEHIWTKDEAWLSDGNPQPPGDYKGGGTG